MNHLAHRFEKTDASPFIRRRRHGSVQILVYHRVTDRPDPYLPSIPLPAFERQMDCLARRFRVMELSEAVEALERSEVPRNAVVVTFDDGYRDNFEFAYPVLASMELPATIFLTTGIVGTERLLWHDRVFHMFSTSEAAVVREFGPEKEDILLGGDAQREAALYKVLKHLRSLAPEARDEQVDRLSEWLGIPELSPGRRLMLNWAEVEEMHRGGISFGAHTVTHPVLSRVSADVAEKEIVESKRAIEGRLKTTITTFAYPNGRSHDFDELTKRLLRDAGYRCAVTTIWGTNSRSSGVWDPFELRRGGPDDLDQALFEAKMNVYRFLS